MELRSKVVVVTGASSGLGREAAIQFAREGCKLVLGARRAEALEDTARACRDAGGEAVAVVCDVTREEDVQRLASTAVDNFGHLDVWVNNAGVTAFAPLESGDFEEHRRVIETNLYGAIFGARACIPIFRRQRAGTLINVGSLLSKVGQPFVPSYVISKYGLRGLSEALRFELADEPDIHICAIYPYAMNTPHFQSGANHIGRHARAMPPAQSPRKVAHSIVDLAKRPRREVHVPRLGVLGLAMHYTFPRTVERLVFDALHRFHFDETPQADTAGNLFAPVDEPPQVDGVRPPQVSTPRFLAWVARQLIMIQVNSIRRRFRRPAALRSPAMQQTATLGGTR